MQGTKMLKCQVGGFLAQQLERALAVEGVTVAEIVRRAMTVYFQTTSVLSNVAERQEGPVVGPSRALGGPAAAPPSSSPPSSPPAPPLTPPSLSMLLHTSKRGYQWRPRRRWR